MTRGPEPGPPGGVRFGTAGGRWILVATVLGSGVAMLDATVVNVALPALGRDLGASMSGLQWTVNAYALTLAGLILLGGSLGDRYGRRRIFVIGVVWFAAASAACGAAQDVTTLVAARALQGVGGALLVPGSLALIQASFAPGERARAVGAWSGLGGIAGAAGPLVGGWLVATAGWRWVFLLNVPLAAVVVLVSLRHVPESAAPPEEGRFDVLGALLAALALAGITFALTEAPGGRAGGAAVIVTALGGLAAGALFVLVERARSGPGRRRARAMLPTEIFGSRLFTAINIVTFVVYAGMGVMFFLLVMTLQVASGYSAIGAGTALLPVTLLMLLLSARAGAVAQRIGPRRPITVGLVVASAGMLLLTRVGPDAPYATVVLPAVVVFALGLSGVVAPLTATVLASVEPRHAGVASGVNNAVARAGGLLAVAAVPPLAGLSDGGGGRGPGSTPTAFAAGFHTAMVISAALLAAGALLAYSTVRDDALADPAREAEPECRSHCPVSAPPLEPGRDGA